MAEVARVLPRDWDLSRLLRFLAGLAMMALAFSAPAPQAPAEPTPVVAVSETVPETSVAVSDPVTVTHPVRATTVPSLPEGLPAPAVASLTLLLFGLAQRSVGPRAPPAA